MAIYSISDQMKPRHSHRKARWAMLFLGKEKAESGNPMLLKHLDHLYTPWGIVGEAYPAVKALTQIGPPACAACLLQLRTEKHSLRQALLCQVLLDSQGLATASKALQIERPKVDNATQRKRLEAAEAKLVELAK